MQQDTQHVDIQQNIVEQFMWFYMLFLYHNVARYNL